MSRFSIVPFLICLLVISDVAVAVVVPTTSATMTPTTIVCLTSCSSGLSGPRL
jgi:hypothetical protein